MTSEHECALFYYLHFLINSVVFLVKKFQASSCLHKGIY